MNPIDGNINFAAKNPTNLYQTVRTHSPWAGDFDTGWGEGGVAPKEISLDRRYQTRVT